MLICYAEVGFSIKKFVNINIILNLIAPSKNYNQDKLPEIRNKKDIETNIEVKKTPVCYEYYFILINIFRARVYGKKEELEHVKSQIILCRRYASLQVQF